jgi:hypothetical protein
LARQKAQLCYVVQVVLREMDLWKYQGCHTWAPQFLPAQCLQYGNLTRHTRTHAYTHMHSCKHTYVNNSYTHRCTHIRAYARMHAHTHIQTCNAIQKRRVLLKPCEVHPHATPLMCRYTCPTYLLLLFRLLQPLGPHS